jgi:hypothetical protein
MRRNHAVILTYPGHFLLTKLVIKNLIQTHPEIQKITIIIDDISLLSWPTYIKDCYDFYKKDVDNIICTSNYPEFFKLKDNPWIRQQMVKLNLDKLLPTDQCIFFCDGDLLLHRWVPVGVTPFTIASYCGVPLDERDPGPGEITSQQSYYVQYMLGIPHTGIKFHNNLICSILDHPLTDDYNNTQLCVSHPPFRDLDLIEIKNLREYVEKRFNQDFITIHFNISQDTRHSVSEWELLAWYKHTVLKQDLKLIHWPTVDIEKLINKDILASTCWRSDRGIDQSWWKAQSIEWETYWQSLPLCK